MSECRLLTEIAKVHIMLYKLARQRRNAVNNNNPNELEIVEEEDAAVQTEVIQEVGEISLMKPESLVDDLDLSLHTEGSWPSSKNVSQ